MNQLTPELWLHVLDFIPYKQLPLLRLVNQSFNQLVIRQFNAVSFVIATNHTGHASPIVENFNFNTFIIRQQGLTVDRLLSLIKNKFPATKALDLYDLYGKIKISQLLDFADRLVYVRAYDIEVDIEFESPEDIMNKFPALAAFDFNYPESPMCVNLWAEKRGETFVQWQNQCKHPRFECGSTGLLSKSTRCVSLHPIESPPSRTRRLELTSVASSIRVLQVEDCPPPSHLSMKQLACFTLSQFKVDFEMSTLLDYIEDSKNLRILRVRVGSAMQSTSLSLLSFVNSLRHLCTLELSVSKVIKRSDKGVPVAYEACEKLRLRDINLSFNQFSRAHFNLMKNLLSSCNSLRAVRLYTNGEVYTCVGLNHWKDDELGISTIGPANLKQLLDILMPHCAGVKHLSLSTKKGVDASFAEPVLTLKQLERIDGHYTEGFVKRWLPQFIESNNRKPIDIHTHQTDIHVLSHEVHDLILSAKNNKILKTFWSSWLCPKRETCNCGLGREFY